MCQAKSAGGKRCSSHNRSREAAHARREARAAVARRDELIEAEASDIEIADARRDAARATAIAILADPKLTSDDISAVCTCDDKAVEAENRATAEAALQAGREAARLSGAASTARMFARDDEAAEFEAQADDERSRMGRLVDALLGNMQRARWTVADRIAGDGDTTDAATEAPVGKADAERGLLSTWVTGVVAEMGEGVGSLLEQALEATTEALEQTVEGATELLEQGAAGVGIHVPTPSPTTSADHDQDADDHEQDDNGGEDQDADGTAESAADPAEVSGHEHDDHDDHDEVETDGDDSEVDAEDDPELRGDDGDQDHDQDQDDESHGGTTSRPTTTASAGMVTSTTSTTPAVTARTASDSGVGAAVAIPTPTRQDRTAATTTPRRSGTAVDGGDEHPAHDDNEAIAFDPSDLAMLTDAELLDLIARLTQSTSATR